MNVKKRYFYQKIFVVFLTVCMLYGCIGKQPVPENNVSETSQTYESYRQEDLDTQKAFSEFCNQVFLENATASSLSLHTTHWQIPPPSESQITRSPLESCPSML